MHYVTNCNYLTLLKVELADIFSWVFFSLFVCLQANCYSMALTALNLTDPKYAWVIRPVEVEEVCVGGSSCMTWVIRPVEVEEVCVGGSSCMTWVIRPVEVEEVCVGGSSCITRGGVTVDTSGVARSQMTPGHCIWSGGGG